MQSTSHSEMMDLIDQAPSSGTDSSTPMPSPPSSFNLLAEVDGLFAGLNLLNDIEPDEDEDNLSDMDGSDIDEDDLEDDDFEHPQPADTISKQPPPQSGDHVPASIWTDLADQIRRLSPSVNLKIPNFRQYIKLLQTSMPGQVTCRSCRPYKDDTFFCSWRNVRDHFLYCHCSPGFMYFASERTLDILQRLMEQPDSKSRILALFTASDGTTPPPHRLSGRRTSPRPSLQTPKIFRDKTKAGQWQCLREIRDNFKSFHRRCLKICRGSDQPVLRRFRKKCGRANDLLNTSILTLRKILRGCSPTSLKEVFAFIALSCAMKSKSTKANEFCPSQEDLLAWKTGVPDRKSRYVFDMLIPLLWPELPPMPPAPQGQFQVAQDDEPELRGSIILYLDLDLYEEHDLNPLSCPPALHSAAHDLMEDSASEFKFHELLSPEYRMLAEAPEGSLTGHPYKFQYPNWHSSESVFSPGPASHLGHTSHQTQTPIPFKSIRSPLINLSPEGSVSEPVISASDAKLIKVLKDTIIFMRVYNFIVYLATRGVLLLYLGLGVDGATSAEGKGERGLGLLEIRTNLLRLINQACRDLNYDHDGTEYNMIDLLPLFKSAMMFLDAGILHNADDIAFYLSKVTILFALDSWQLAVQQVFDCMIVRSTSMKVIPPDYETYFGTQATQVTQPQATQEQTQWRSLNIRPSHASYQAASMRPPSPELFYSGSPGEPPTLSLSQSESLSGPEMVAARARNTTHAVARCSDSLCHDIIFYGADCENSLQRHKRQVHLGRRFSCPRCTKVDPRRYVITKHVEKEHGMDKAVAETLVPKSNHREPNRRRRNRLVSSEVR